MVNNYCTYHKLWPGLLLLPISMGHLSEFQQNTFIKCFHKYIGQIFSFAVNSYKSKYVQGSVCMDTMGRPALTLTSRATVCNSNWVQPISSYYGHQSYIYFNIINRHIHIHMYSYVQLWHAKIMKENRQT